MKRIAAVVRPEKLEPLKEALFQAKISGMTIYQVHGCGNQHGWKEYFRGSEVFLNMIPKVKFEIDRSIVSNVAGTTRDAIDTMVEHEGQFYTIVDTAGLRKKSVIDEDVEYYGFVRAMRAIDRAEVVLLVIDSTIGLTDQDQRVAGMAAERGCAMVVVLNKWDLVEGPDAKAEVRERIEDRLKFVGYAPVIAISALSGKNVQRIWGAINEAYSNYSKSISTSRLNNWLQDIREFGHTISKGKRILKLKYVTQTGVQPPFFTFFCNHPDLVEPSFERYLENRLRSTFDFTGTPINLKFKKKD